ncbi:MAG: cupin domain-containing protein [Actinomycetota bacterium]
MNRRNLISQALPGLLLAAAAEAQAHEAANGAAKPGKPSELLKHALKEVEGKEVTLVRVDYPAGGASMPHRHSGTVIGYVLEGAVVMGLDGGPERTYRKGEAFFEEPGQLHGVSRNASKSRPASILAFVIGDLGAPVTVPAVTKG